MAKESKIITNLKSVRESTGMTQQELADIIGMRRETILHLENNRYNPSLEMALKIAQVFNLKIETSLNSDRKRKHNSFRDLVLSSLIN